MISKAVKPFCQAAGVMVLAPFFIPRILAKEGVDCHECRMKRLPKAHELPLYEVSDEKLLSEITEQPKSSLEEMISVTRKTTTKYVDALDGARKRAVEVYHTGVAHSKSTYDYITEEGNVVPRSLVIASGGLFGMLLGIRGGKFKKVFYASLGVGAVASACYPAQAKEYASKGYEIASEQTVKLVKEYGGYDLNSAPADIKEKFSSVSLSEKLSNINISEKISGLAQTTKEFFGKFLLSKKPEQAAEGDVGMSKPEDKDLYTTRTK